MATDTQSIPPVITKLLKTTAIRLILAIDVDREQIAKIARF